LGSVNTYILTSKGFVSINHHDLKTRYSVGWSVSNSICAEWFTEVMREAIKKRGKPEIFNTEQGSQFTSVIFTNKLKLNEIDIAMNGKGRALDNIFVERLWKGVKYKNIYLIIYKNGNELYVELNEYFKLYNNERLHQSLGYETPNMK